MRSCHLLKMSVFFTIMFAQMMGAKLNKSSWSWWLNNDHHQQRSTQQTKKSNSPSLEQVCSIIFFNFGGKCMQLVTLKASDENKFKSSGISRLETTILRVWDAEDSEERWLWWWWRRGWAGHCSPETGQEETQSQQDDVQRSTTANIEEKFFTQSTFVTIKVFIDNQTEPNMW